MPGLGRSPRESEELHAPEVVDVEHALDPTYASHCGVNLNDLLISQPDTGEQALEITEALVRSGAVDIIVIDSVAALVSQAEIEGEMGDTHVALQARLMSQALRKLAAAAASDTTASSPSDEINLSLLKYAPVSSIRL